tara:strand:+ start:82 stop:282 length:201 start_codon:yes stop_codon:yes gene_type:complete
MVIRRTCAINGKTRTMDLPISEKELKDWERGTPIQEAMPRLTPDQREFVLTGLLPDEWEELFSKYP